MLLDGTLVMSRKVGDDEVEVNRTSFRGSYVGAWTAYLGDLVPQVYDQSVRVTEPSTFFQLDAAVLRDVMEQWFPMAQHLLTGLFQGYTTRQRTIDQRERLLALGSLSAGLTHELNNPAAAAVRATSTLQQRVSKMREKLAALASGNLDEAALQTLIKFQDEAAQRVAQAPRLSAIESADREDELSDWLEAHGCPHALRARAHVRAGRHRWGLARRPRQRRTARIARERRALALLHDRHRAADEGDHRLDHPHLHACSRPPSSTPRWTAHHTRPPTCATCSTAPWSCWPARSRLASPSSRSTTSRLPPVPSYPAELNQVWTNLIDNAVQAMGDEGRLTIRTRHDDEYAIVEIGDTGPGIPADVKDRIFEPFFTTKPIGHGTGLGLDIAWRIVVNKHRGYLKVSLGAGRDDVHRSAAPRGPADRRDDLVRLRQRLCARHALRRRRVLPYGVRRGAGPRRMHLEPTGHSTGQSAKDRRTR